MELNLSKNLRTDPDALRTVSKDYGNLVHETPSAVFYPSSVDEIIDLVKLSNNCSVPFGVAARGHGHSVRGQAMAGGGGVVVEMSALGRNGVGTRVSWSPSLGFYADVGGEQLWIDVLRDTLEHGVAPVSWTDYLHLTVGGTLSNAGIGGQSFLHGPQISNVLELDVITGKGDLLTCSKNTNSELFFAVLGGLGQFGIITRARIHLETAPSRARWVKLIYDDFSSFTRDQEHLISTGGAGPDYVEGSVITDRSLPNTWRSSFSAAASHQSGIDSLLKRSNGLLYSIELVKYYDDHSTVRSVIDEEVELLLKKLNFVPEFIQEKDVGFVEFLNRVTIGESDMSEGHPWLNLFVPKSSVHDFKAGVFADIFRRHNQTFGPILFYPFNRKKWDDRMSTVIPEEDIFYTLGLLHSTSPSEQAEIDDKLNDEILKFCDEAGIQIKQYLPHYKLKEDWIKHYGLKWETFRERKFKFDPKMILSPGQRIFCTRESMNACT